MHILNLTATHGIYVKTQSLNVRINKCFTCRYIIIRINFWIIYSHFKIDEISNGTSSVILSEPDLDYVKEVNVKGNEVTEGDKNNMPND